MSKCVYLACMAVKIEHTVGGHNHDILQQCISDIYGSRSLGPQPASKLPKYMPIETYLHTRKIKYK